MDWKYILLYTTAFIYITTLESETTDQQEIIEQILTTDSCFQNKPSKDNCLNSPNWEFQCLRNSILYIFRREPIIPKEQLIHELAAQSVSFYLNFWICKLNKNVFIWKKKGIFLKKKSKKINETVHILCDFEKSCSKSQTKSIMLPWVTWFYNHVHF